MKLALPILCLALVGSATAQTKVFDVLLSGGQESPPVTTNGSGRAKVTLDTATGAVTVNGTYTNLGSTVRAAHIHGTARRGANAGVFVSTPPSGGTSGTFSGSATLTATQMQDMLDGLTYLNVHTANNGGGEIRGQIDDVPGSGSPGAAPVDVTGAATAGGTLKISCPPAAGRQWVLIGLALPPCQTLSINPPLACAPGPANLGIDLILTPIAIMGNGANVTIPATLTMIDITVQCLSINPPLCLELSRATRIAIRP